MNARPPDTGRGAADQPLAYPIPSSPNVFFPQQATVPSVLIPQLVRYPGLALTNPVAPGTAAGVARLVGQQYTAPPTATPQVLPLSLTSSEMYLMPPGMT